MLIKHVWRAVFVLHRPLQRSPKICQSWFFEASCFAHDRDPLAASIGQNLRSGHWFDARQLADFLRHFGGHARGRRRFGSSLQTLKLAAFDRRSIALAAFNQIQRFARHWI